MYLVDTNVVSELRKARQGKANRNVVRWRVAADSSTLYLSVVTVHELEIGILLSERRNAANAVALRVWMDDHIIPSYSGRILCPLALRRQHAVNRRTGASPVT
jgi:predicted nucleic acid-binding protein